MRPISFDNSYVRLPNTFYRRVSPSDVSKPELIRVNRQLADELDIDAEWLASDEGSEITAGPKWFRKISLFLPLFITGCFTCSTI